MSPVLIVAAILCLIVALQGLCRALDNEHEGALIALFFLLFGVGNVILIWTTI